MDIYLQKHCLGLGSHLLTCAHLENVRIPLRNMQVMQQYQRCMNKSVNAKSEFLKSSLDEESGILEYYTVWIHK